MVLYLLLTISQAWSLPVCEGDESNWQNCEGSLTSGTGTIYTGTFRDGIFEGRNDEYGLNYVGEYKDGNMNGQGTFTYADGTKYVGEWKEGKYHGQGTYTNADGTKYIGEFKDGMFHGQGTYTNADGTKYIGEFKDGMFHGQGTYTSPDGSVLVGQFIKNKCPNCKKYSAGEYSDHVDRNKKEPTNIQEVRAKKERKSKEIEQANDNIRIALDALNYTFTGNKKERKTIVLDAENCIFEREYYWLGLAKQYDKLYLNNVIIDTIRFYDKRYYDENFKQWVEAILIRFSGDEKVLYLGVYNMNGIQSESKEYEGVVSDSADLERVQKAWGVIYSRACKGASAGEF